MKRLLLGMLLLSLAVPVHAVKAKYSIAVSTKTNQAGYTVRGQQDYQIGGDTSTYVLRFSSSGATLPTTAGFFTGAGAGTGLNADMIDGVHSSGFAVTTDSPTWSGTHTFNKAVTASAFVGALESQSIDIVRLANQGIADNDTDTLVFDFVPSRIEISWSGASTKSSTSQLGGATGHTDISITGTDVYQSTMTGTRLWNSNGIPRYAAVNTSLDTTYILKVTSGDDGATQGNYVATGVWTTATKTLTLTYQETATTSGDNYVEMVATAYR